MAMRWAVSIALCAIGGDGCVQICDSRDGNRLYQELGIAGFQDGR